MDDTSSFASDKSSHKSFKKSTADDVEDPGGIFYNANEMDEEVDLNFVVDDDVGPMVEDAGEAAEQSPTLLHSGSPNSTVQDQVYTKTVKATKSSGNEPPYNRWLKLIDSAGARTRHLFNCLKLKIVAGEHAIGCGG